MDREIRENLKYGDKIVIDEGVLSWYTGNSDMLKFCNQEVTFSRWAGGDIKIVEDDSTYYWHPKVFKNIINGYL